MSAVFSFILAVLCPALVIGADVQCGKQCRFRLCKLNGRATLSVKGRRLNLRGPGTALSPYVCLPNKPDARKIKTGEALVSTKKKGKNALRMSKYRPRGLRKKFSRKYFQLYPITYTDGLQGVGRMASKSNQEDFLDNLCVVLPVTSYESDGRRVTTSNKKDCVSFGTRTEAIVVELQWSSSDDFELSVEEPNGTVIDLENKSSGTGSLNNDLGLGCGEVPPPPSGKENVFYRPNLQIQNGEYKAIVTHFSNCGDGPTDWKLRVIVNGVIVVAEDGTSNKGMSGSEKIFETTFMYP